MQLLSSLARWYLVSGLLLLATACSVGNAGDAEEGFRKFENIYEPSGVQQLPDGRFIVVEDESSQPISLFTLGPDGDAEEQALWRRSLTGWLSSNRALGSLEDLEDISIDADGRIYAITSHSRKSGGKRDDQRRDAQKPRSFTSGPDRKRDRIDPDNPFAAALMGLKDKT